ncbi:recombination mediator RecR [Candidatus Poriferisodalis sp.]|uniref:recombination mediator RecR n=1 Tax=Candidatus Poriferisodalis sp. TaxID=3101277 RepID=UPI003B01EF15
MYDDSVEELIDELSRLPGIGPKGAQRIVFWLLKRPAADAHRLATAITAAKDRVGWCSLCWNLSETDPCSICADPARGNGTICVVEEPRDVIAMDKAGFRGRYHVLGGALNPLEGIGPEQLRIRELLARLDSEAVTELIVCTNPNIEGDTTAMFLARQLAPLGVQVTRLASGLPVGGDLEYADELTLERALRHRRALESS